MTGEKNHTVDKYCYKCNTNVSLYKQALNRFSYNGHYGVRSLTWWLFTNCATATVYLGIYHYYHYHTTIIGDHSGQFSAKVKYSSFTISQHNTKHYLDIRHSSIGLDINILYIYNLFITLNSIWRPTIVCALTNQLGWSSTASLLTVQLGNHPLQHQFN